MTSPVRTRPAASRRRAPAPRHSLDPTDASAAVVEGARVLLHAQGAVLLRTGARPSVIDQRGLDARQLAGFVDLAASGRTRQCTGDQLLVLVAVPLGQRTGMLGLLFPGMSTLSAEEEQALTRFTDLIKSNAGPQRRSESRRLLAVNAIQESISAQSPLSEVFRSMYERAAEEIDTPTFIAALYDAGTQTARYGYVMQDGIERPPSDFEPRPAAGALAEAVRTGRPQYVDEVARLSSKTRAAILGDGPRPVRSMLVVPMVRRHEVLGVIEAQSYQPAAFTDDDIYLLSTLANQAAVALESARLLEDSRRQVERLTLLNQIVMATSHAGDIPEACQRVLGLLCRSLPGIDMATAWLLDSDQQSLLRLASTGGSASEPSDAAPVRLPLDLSRAIARAVRSGRHQVIQVPAGADLPAETRPFAARSKVATLISVPMRSGQRIVGALALAAANRHEVDQAEGEFLETLAGQVGAQLEAVILHEREDEERRRLQAMIENLPEAIAIADAEGRIITYNHAAEVLWGHPAREATMQQAPQVYGLCSPDGRPLPWQETPLARSLLQDEPSAGRELLIRRPDGSEAPILSNCVPVHDHQGKLTGSVEVFQDISRLKEIDRLKDDFINTVSHELRTPTTTIRGGALTLLRRGESLDEATKRQLLRDMSEEAERLHILVEDLLSLARAQAGMQLSTEPIIPHRFVNHMILELGGRVGDHTLTVQVPADVSMVEADPFCLEQIFRNLLENAVKFSPRGQRIEITAEEGEDEVIFSILDRGSGVPAKDMDRVFEPFYRSNEVISAGAQGAGLGLAVCRRLVEMQGGRIWAESRTGGGTVFHFTLPSVGEPAEEDDWLPAGGV